jgi:hypothetical protein
MSTFALFFRNVRSEAKKDVKFVIDMAFFKVIMFPSTQ